MTIATTRLVIVCTEAAVPNINDGLRNIGEGATGADVMNVQVALVDSPTVPVGRRASWATDGTTQGQITSALASGGARPAERRIYEPGDTVPAWGSQNLWLFNGNTWDGDAPLGVLGLVPWTDPAGDL